jgi:hypothetical protein
METNDGVGCYIWCISGMVFREFGKAGWIVEKTSPNLGEDDLQGFPN